MPYLGNGLTKFTTADDLTVSGTSELKDNVTVTGDVTASGTLLPTGDTAAGDDAAIGFTSAEGLILTGQGSTSDITVKNDADATVFTVPTGTDDILFPDGAKAMFGAASDLQIFHDSGGNSFINESGSGSLVIKATNTFINASDDAAMAAFYDTAQVELYHNASKKFETTSSGVSVTGGITVSNNIFETAGTTSIRPAGTEIVTINNTGDVTVIGQGSNRAMMLLKAGSNTANSQLRFGDQAADSAGRIMYDHSSNYMRFDTNEAEKMRLDSSGNLLVGKTAASFDNVGFQVTQVGQAAFTRDNATVLYVNRQTSEGNTIEIRQDNDAQLIIGSKFSGRGYISTNASNTTGIRFDTNFIAPCDHTGANCDDAIDIGSSGARFKNAYIKGTVFAEAFTGESDTDTSIQMTGSNIIKFFTNSSERARFDNSGNFQVGATTNNYSAQNGFGVNNSGSTYTFVAHPNGAPNSAVYSVFSYNGGIIGSISQSGTTAVSYNTGSDRRLKSNIEDAASASDKIDAIQVRQFDWKADNSHQDYGLIAQELQPIEPLAVTGDADSDEMMGVDYSKLIPMLLKEIQSLRSRVATLEAS